MDTTTKAIATKPPRLPYDVIAVIADMYTRNRVMIFHYRQLLAIPSFARRAIRNRAYWISHYTIRVSTNYETIADEWRVVGKLHREGGPARTYHNGQIEYYHHGLLHRRDGPAAIKVGGIEEWWINGQLHRNDGPAIMDNNGNEEWWLNGVLHRADEPAITILKDTDDWSKNVQRYREDGIIEADRKEWWRYGQRHRSDGPAIINQKAAEWWLNGVRHREGGPAIIRSDNTEEWWFNGMLHRENPIFGEMKPAKTFFKLGYRVREYWYVGTRHREDGPAIEHINMITNEPEEEKEEWYQWGKRHRIGGPARYVNGLPEYWIDDEQVEYA